MIKEIKIENFKSIQSLNLELGRLNVFIGANGSGKSNILEGIGFGCAAAIHKLDNEFLAPRGIRVTNPTLMKSAFDLTNIKNEIKVAFAGKGKEDNEVNLELTLTFEKKWIAKPSIQTNALMNFLRKVLSKALI